LDRGIRAEEPAQALIDRRGAMVDDLAEARDHATRVVHPSPTSSISGIGVIGSACQGDELLVVPFTFVLGKPN
jgi:hypothetical protein